MFCCRVSPEPCVPQPRCGVREPGQFIGIGQALLGRFQSGVSGGAAQSVGFSGEVDELHCAVLGNHSSDIPISLTLARGQNQFGTRHGWVVFCALIHHTGKGPSPEHEALQKADTPVLLLRPLG